MSGDIFACHNWKRCYWKLGNRGQNAAKYPIGQSPTAKNYLVPNVNTATAEISSPRRSYIKTWVLRKNAVLHTLKITWVGNSDYLVQFSHSTEEENEVQQGEKIKPRVTEQFSSNAVYIKELWDIYEFIYQRYLVSTWALHTSSMYVPGIFLVLEIKQ